MHPVSDLAAGRGPVIAVVGGGASGTLAAVYLLREAERRRVPLRVALIDRDGRHGLGRAYSTTHPAHLLNSPAGAMSAVAGDPAHLTRWAAEAGLPDDGFLPGSAYGRYLTELLAAAERSAQPAARLSRITSEVVAIRRASQGRALRLHLAATAGSTPMPLCWPPVICRRGRHARSCRATVILPIRGNPARWRLPWTAATGLRPGPARSATPGTGRRRAGRPA